MQNFEKKLKEIGEYGAAGLFEEPERSLFYRKALAIGRYYENCKPSEYNGEKLYPSGKINPEMKVYPGFLYGMNIDFSIADDVGKEITDALDKEIYKWHSTVWKEHIVSGDMYTHSMPHYERVLKEGLLSYIPRIEKIADKDMREGLLHIIEGIKKYIENSICYLKSVNADEKLINTLEKVPLYPAENIYEAIEAWNFVMYLDSCDNLGCLASGLMPYYNGEDITELIENIYDNLNDNDGYSMSLGTDYSPLTIQCLEAVKGKRRPMIELFVDENTPDEIWNKAFESIKTSNGQPAFYNGNVLLKGLQKKFDYITDEELKKFCGGGCTESMLAGISNVGSVDAGINLPLILENVINMFLEKSKTFEEFYKYYIDEVRFVTDRVTEEISNSQITRAKENPLPMRTLLVDDCIDNQKDFNDGGARCKWSIINYAGMINVIDSMLVIKELVFRQKRFKADELIVNLRTDNAEFSEIAKKCKPCFGTDNEEANKFAERISNDIYSMLDDKCPAIGDGFLPSSIQFMSQAYAGSMVGATPDGRRAGTPLCDSLGAIFAKDDKGPTALLKSVTSLKLEKALGTPVLNFNINPDFDEKILKSLILTYMQLGGIQIQMSCVSLDTLLKAYDNPYEYKNLVVRVGGFSEYFCRLTDDVKKVVINRTIQNLER